MEKRNLANLLARHGLSFSPSPFPFQLWDRTVRIRRGKNAMILAQWWTRSKLPSDPGLLLLWKGMKRIELQTFPAFQRSCSGNQDLGTDPRLELRPGICAIVRWHWASDFLSQFVQRTLLRKMYILSPYPRNERGCGREAERPSWAFHGRTLGKG